MKKIYSLLLTAAALLVGTNAWAATRTAKDGAEFKNAWEAAANGDVIKLTSDVTIDKTLWLGTANMNDEAKSITLDLNGWTLTNSQNDLAYMIVITHGALNITGNGYIVQNGSKAEEAIRLTGSTYDNVNPKTATSGFYSHLTIGEGVQINAAKNGIVIDEIDNVTFLSTKSSGKYYLHADHSWATAGVEARSTKPYSTEVFKGTRGIANGVRIDVSGKIEAGKYAMKTNGNLGGPSNTLKDAADLSGYYSDLDHTIQYSGFDAAHAPFVHIHSTADLRVPASSSGDKQPVSVYCSGYARWLIEGTCVGASGVYVKSGEVAIHDANIQSNATTYTAASATNSGVTGSGSALVIESSAVYAGYIDVDISGDSHLSATSGYAIDESITYGQEYQDGESKVNTITISGGSFDGGSAGVMTVCPQTAAEAVDTQDETTITIIGGQTDGGSVTIGNENLEDYLSQQTNSTHVVWVDNGDNTTTMVISQGAANDIVPVTYWEDIEPLSSKTTPADVKWEAIENATMSANTIYLGELQINSGSANNLQQLTIPANKTLQVKNLIMNSYARIIVEAGGKLIVTGEQGIIAPKKENILLQHNSATGEFASLLFDPAAVSSNKHPNATVEFTSQSWRIDSDHLQWEWFGIPTYTAATAITATCPAFVAVYENEGWSNIGLVSAINADPNKLAKLNKPFAAYDLLANRLKTDDDPEITISGEMVGNVDAVLNVNLHWTPVANSYTAEIDAEAFVNALKNSSNITDAIYVAEHNANTGKLTWETKPADELNGLKLKPMQAFLLNNPRYVEEVKIDYASMVYAPATAAGAPRRSAANEYAAKVTINVANEDGTWDNVDLRENSNAKSYEKYLNDDVNIYVLDGEKNDYVVAEDLENAYVGFSTVEGGNFTISFTKAEGREFDMIDLETGAKVAVAEGETYSFSAAANYANDYRFKLVERAKMPTAIENTEVKANVKGIYTITGQYLGEMNVWNTLPAGVYVVNGAKLVK